MPRHVVCPLRPLLVFALVFAVASCGTGDVGKSTLSDVDPGTPRSTLLTKIGTGPLTATGADTVRVVNGFRHMVFFTDGRQFEVIYFRDAIGKVSEPVEQEVETPIVLADGKVLGWGWKFYVEEGMKKYHLPTPLVEKAPPAATPTPGASAPKPRPAPGAATAAELGEQKKM